MICSMLRWWKKLNGRRLVVIPGSSHGAVTIGWTVTGTAEFEVPSLVNMLSRRIHIASEQWKLR